MKVIKIILFTLLIILILLGFILFGGGKGLIYAGRGVQRLEVSLKKRLNNLCQTNKILQDYIGKNDTESKTKLTKGKTRK